MPDCTLEELVSDSIKPFGTISIANKVIRTSNPSLKTVPKHHLLLKGPGFLEETFDSRNGWDTGNTR